MLLHIKGRSCIEGVYNRGAFKYLPVFLQEHDMPTEGGLWHDGHVASKKTNTEQVWYAKLSQTILRWTLPIRYDQSKVPGVAVSAVWVNCTAFPSNLHGRAYTGYFDSSSSMLNRVWYAGAYTLQLSTIDPKEGGSIIQFNRLFDGNTAPVGAWYSNYTIARGMTVTTDGAKRYRMVWPGDMTIAVPGIAVSTYDMLAVRNALDVIYDHQYSDGSMPYAGPPIGEFGEFSDTASYYCSDAVSAKIQVIKGSPFCKASLWDTWWWLLQNICMSILIFITNANLNTKLARSLSHLL